MVAGRAPWTLARVICIAATLIGCNEALFFELKPGANAGECFKISPGTQHACHGSYEADGPEEGVVARLIDPDGKDAWRSTESSAKFEFKVVTECVHQLCFQSTVADNQMISFNFHFEAHGGGADASHKEFVTKDHTDIVGDLVAKLETRTIDILDQQQYAITREAVHRDTAESTNGRVIWWTAVEVLVLIVLAAFQVYYLKSYFEVKQVV